MRTVYRLLLWAFIPLAGHAQKVEFGAGGGPTFYKGDLQPRFRPLNPGIGGNLILRYNLDKVISAKLQVMYGLVHGEDRHSGDPFLKERDFSFRNTLLDYALQVEYNFLNFRTHDGHYEHDWTPYLFAGYGRSHTLKKVISAGTNTFSYSNGSTGIVPFGIGLKKMLGPRLNLSAEFSTRAFLNKKKGSLFDGLDGNAQQNSYTENGLVSDPRKDDFFLYPNTRQKDKYFQVSVTLSYLIYRVNCKIPGKKFSLF